MKSKEENFKHLKQRIAISNLLKEEEMKQKPSIVNIIKPVIAASVMLVSFSGIVFSKDISSAIYNNYFTGKGIEKAINEGYIEKVDMENQTSNSTIENEETGEIIEDNDTTIKVSELIMDDFTLSMTFDVTLSEKIKNVISAEEVMKMYFPYMVVTDENNVDLSQMSGVNIFTSDRNKDTVKVVYNFYTGGESVYPKSKELHMNINKIKISKNETRMGYEEITIKGDWNFKISVPEKMYNRENITYMQKSTTNKDFNVLSATLYNTGMEIKFKFKAEKEKSTVAIESELSKEIEFWWSLDENDELKNVDILNYLEHKLKENPEYQKQMQEKLDRWKYEKYLTNSKGERFGFTEGPRENGGGTIDDNGILTATCMFDLTKYDATDEITLHLDYKGNKADIVLERVK